MLSSVLAALKAMPSTGPPRARYSIGEITPSVRFSATVSMVAQRISRLDRFAVSRPTMRPTRVRPASSEVSRALRTPSASSARFRADRHIHAIRHIPTNRGQ